MPSQTVRKLQPKVLSPLGDERSNDDIARDVAQTVADLVYLSKQIDVKTLARRIGMPTSTLYSRLKFTTRFTPAELYRIAAVFDVPMGELCADPETIRERYLQGFRTGSRRGALDHSVGRSPVRGLPSMRDPEQSFAPSPPPRLTLVSEPARRVAVR